MQSFFYFATIRNSHSDNHYRYTLNCQVMRIKNYILLCHYVIKEVVHAFSCSHIELWMHLGNLENTQVATPRATLTLLSWSCIHACMDLINIYLFIIYLSFNQYIDSSRYKRVNYILLLAGSLVINSNFAFLL